MQNQFVKKLVKLEEQIKQFKTSQFLGGSNSTTYILAKNYQVDVSVPSGKDLIVIYFTSAIRPFPKMSILLKSVTSGSSDLTSSTNLIHPRIGSTGYSSDIYKTSMVIDLPVALTDRTIHLIMDIFADTTGNISMEVTV